MEPTKPPTVVERITLLEKRQAGLDESLDKTLNQVRSTLASAMEVLDAAVLVLADLNLVVDLPGKIQARIESNRAERQESMLAQARLERQTLVDRGVLAKADVIGPTSVLVVKVTNEAGQVVGPAEQTVEFEQVHEHMKPAFLGQGVGFVFVAPNNEKIEIVDIFEVVAQPSAPEKAEVPPAPVQ